MSRYRITAADLPFAREFLRDPAAPASPGLQRVLNRMRTDTTRGKYVLIAVEPHRRWRLARSPCVRGRPIEIVPGVEFDDRLEAERTVFRLRWRELTGEDLEA
ncbi:MAG: hypothetical protein KDC48_19860 [Planctomycetes bacterium]|nr:hypothetical protein [Planctomycetota bacterium]